MKEWMDSYGSKMSRPICLRDELGLEENKRTKIFMTEVNLWIRQNKVIHF